MRETAQQKIRELFHSSVSDNLLLYDFDLFDRSVSQKLWSTGYYCKHVSSLDINQFLVWPSASDSDTFDVPSRRSVIVRSQLVDAPDFCSHLNLFLDGFFMNAMSTLDTLAHELFLLYESQRRPAHIKIDTARSMLRDIHPNSEVGRLLDDQLSKPWFKEFEPFRHCTTHESLIRYSDIVYIFDQVTIKYSLSRDIKLPDNPQAKPFTYCRNRAAKQYCWFIFGKIERLVSGVYRLALRDIRANGNILPIPVP